jgi:hypothetical protein
VVWDVLVQRPRRIRCTGNRTLTALPERLRFQLDACSGVADRDADKGVGHDHCPSSWFFSPVRQISPLESANARAGGLSTGASSVFVVI